ncbi:MAG: hypothetical protein HFE58_06975 [Firmicutes bacterium]|jgi:hypothetical protein|nr:hypothetical protein [Bacillota bacterium]
MEKYIVALIMSITTFGQLSNEAVLVEPQQQNVFVIQVNDKYYYSDGKESEFGARCGVMDGEITSTVKQTEIPNKNNQSNFGKNYGYQYVDDTIEVNIDGKWIVFEEQNK